MERDFQVLDWKYKLLVEKVIDRCRMEEIINKYKLKLLYMQVHAKNRIYPGEAAGIRLIKSKKKHKIRAHLHPHLTNNIFSINFNFQSFLYFLRNYFLLPKNTKLHAFCNFYLTCYETVQLQHIDLCIS